VRERVRLFAQPSWLGDFPELVVGIEASLRLIAEMREEASRSQAAASAPVRALGTKVKKRKSCASAQIVMFHFVRIKITALT
jgi:hypothetical protein